MINSFLQKLKRIGQFSLNTLFKPIESLHTKWVVIALFAGLFAAGMLQWGFFLDWFNNRFDIQDWHLHVGPYLDFVSKALKSGQFPLHADSPYMIPSRYLARQNRPFSPQILLLYFLNPATYVLVNVWILYSLSFVGLLLIRARYQLSFVSFLSLFLLFNLNGHIVAHMGVGHFEWVRYFLLPFYVLLIMKMVEGEKTGWKWMLSMSLLMLVITLQGAAHFFIYCITFLFLLALFQPHLFSPIIKAIVLCILVSMIRILPPALQFAGGTGLKFLGGFESVYQFLQVFTSPSNQGYWEKTYYVGVIGFAFILYSGIIKTWMKEERYRALFLPIIVMIFFSVGSIYLPLFSSHIPFLDSQRAPTRFVIIPLVFLITLASIQFQSLINEWKNSWEKKVIVLFGMALMAYDLIYNSRVWSLQNYGVSKRATDIISVSVASYPDPAYITTLIIGSACTLITLIGLIFLAYREQKQTV
ncbi:MAG: hypothetical protein H7Y59_00025 [Anaerolineales bacterium]|nr:hypothetical protein [Anaerolineales bacterium]